MALGYLGVASRGRVSQLSCSCLYDMSFTVGHFVDPMGASLATFPPFSVVAMAPLSISHLFHALEKNCVL